MRLPGATFPPPPRCDRGLRAGADTPRRGRERLALVRRVGGGDDQTNDRYYRPDVKGILVNRCASCHGRIDQMDVVRQEQPLSMGWCLDCHRNPEPHLRPRGVSVTDMEWQPNPDRRVEPVRGQFGAFLFAVANHIVVDTATAAQLVIVGAFASAGAAGARIRTHQGKSVDLRIVPGAEVGASLLMRPE